MSTYNQSNPTVFDTPWFEADERHVGDSVCQLGSWLWHQDINRRDELDRTLRRFSRRGLRGLFLEFANTEPIRVNLTKAVTETLVAKVGSDRPRPKIITSGADWRTRRKAKGLQRFTDAVYKAQDVHRETQMAFRDAVLAGTGIVHVYPKLAGKKSHIAVERVFPTELLVSGYEAVNGCPQTLVRTQFVDRYVLAASYPEQRDAILSLPSANQIDIPSFEIVDGAEAAFVSPTFQLVQVWEAWNLATHDVKGKCVPGRHVIAAGGGSGLALHDEPYERTDFPFAFFHWCPPTRGFWGDSAAGEVHGYEREMNSLLQKTQRAMRRVGQPIVLVPSKAGIKESKLTNDTALVLSYDGQVPPQIVTSQPIHPQILDQVWRLQAKAFEQLGTNEQQAAGIKPPGIESGRGLEQLSEDHLLRFKHVAQAYEQFAAIDICRLIVHAAAELHEQLKAAGFGGFKVREQDRKGSVWLDLDWSDVGVSPDDVSVQVWPTSVLPISPSGRTEEVERWQANGWITPQRAMALLEFPDLESETDLQTADTELVDYQIEQMLDNKRDDVLPDPVQNLDYARKRVTFALEKAIQDQAPLQATDHLRTYLLACEALVPPPEAPPTPPSATAGAVPANTEVLPTAPISVAPGGPMPGPLPTA